MKTMLLAMALLAGGFCAAQTNVIITEKGAQCKKPVADGLHEPRKLEKPFLEYDPIHEKDVMWEKRIWQEIPLGSKRNHYFAYAKRPLINILLELAQNEDITLYSPIDDEFKNPLQVEELGSLGGEPDTLIVVDPETFAETMQVVHNDFDPNTVKKYRIKEVWFFDEESSNMGVRILGLAPVVQRLDSEGQPMHEAALFWVYYPAIRQFLAQEQAYNGFNDASELSWYDVFEARLFESRIIKESNVFDRRIQDYASGMDALLEGEKIKEGMRNFELDMWQH